MQLYIKPVPLGVTEGMTQWVLPSLLYQKGTGRDGLTGSSSFVQAVGAELGKGAAQAPSCQAGLLPAAHSLKGGPLFAFHDLEIQATHPITGHNNMTSKPFWIKKRESGLWREETPLFLQEAITFSDFSMGKAGWKASNYLFHWNSFQQSHSWMQDTCACQHLKQAKASVPMGVCGAPFAWPSSALDRQYLSKEGLPLDKECLPTVMWRLLASNSLWKGRGVPGRQDMGSGKEHTQAAV